MQPDEAERIFNEALQITNSGERMGYVRGACGKDSALFGKVERLLLAHEKAVSILPTELGEFPGGTTLLSEGPGTVIGRYKLLQQIGEGGFGVVYMAEQTEPVRRRVALKIIKLGMDTKQVVARFEAERQALALMDHPNIARVLDAGATDTGRPYFVMELVKGILITKFCDENNLTAQDRLELFIPVCQAVQHAHQKGVIHRDLKPSNILVTMHDDKPVPKVIDFGIAKATQQELTTKTLFTQFHQFIGTPAYMSPEQAQMSGLDIDTRSDIYSLGVLLYELLTGQTPFDARELLRGGYEEIRRRIREEEPPKPSTRLNTLQAEQRTTVARHRRSEPNKLGILLRRDLDWIVMKALEKDRTRRYETANGLVQDIQRYLHDEPVSAAAPSPFYKFRKFARRNQGALAATTAIVAALVIATAVSAWQAVRAKRAETAAAADAQRAHTAQEAETLHRRNAEANEAKAQSLVVEARHEQGKAILERAHTLKEQKRYFEANLTAAQALGYQGYGRRENSASFVTNFPVLLKPGSDAEAEAKLFLRREPDYAPVWRTPAGWHHDDGNVGGLAFTKDGTTLISRSSPSIRRWEVETGRLQAEFDSTRRNRIPSPDGAWFLGDVDNRMVVFDARTGNERCALEGTVEDAGGQQPFYITYSRDSRRVGVYWPSRKLRLFDLSNGRLISEIDDMPAQPVATALDQTGKTLALAAPDNAILLREVETGRRIGELRGHSKPVGSLLFANEGNLLASGSDDNTIRIWNVSEKQSLKVLDGHRGAIRCLVFSAKDETLYSGSSASEILRWNVKEGQLQNRWAARDRPVTSLALNSQGDMLASAADDSVILIWDTAKQEPRFLPQGHTGQVNSVAVSPDGALVASSSDDFTIRLWRTADGGTEKILRGHQAPVHSVAWSPDGAKLASVDAQAKVRVWNAKSGESERILDPGSPARDNFRWIRARTVEFSPDGRWIASRRDATPVIWNAETGEKIVELDRMAENITSLAFEPDGSALALGDSQGNIRVWDFEAKAARFTVKSLKGFVAGLVFSPQGQRLFADGDRGLVQVYDASSGKLTSSFGGYGVDDFYSMAMSPDGTLLASAGGDSVVRLWNLKSESEKAALIGHRWQVTCVDFGPDGSFLISGSLDGTVMAWDLSKTQPRAKWDGLASQIRDVSYSPTGGQLRSIDQNGNLEMRDPSTGELMDFKSNYFRPPPEKVCWTSKTNEVAAGFGDGTLAIYDLSGATPTRQLNEHTNSIAAFAISSVSQLAASVSRDQLLVIWDAKTWKKERSWKTPDRVLNLVWTPDGRHVASSSYSRKVTLWNAQTGVKEQEFELEKGWIHGLAFSKDRQTLITTGSDLVYWDFSTGKIAWRGPTVEDDQYGAPILSPDGTLLALSKHRMNHGLTAGLVIQIRDFKSNRILSEYSIVPTEVPRTYYEPQMDFSPDGRLLAVGIFETMGGYSSSPSSTTIRVLDVASMLGTGAELSEYLDYYTFKERELEWVRGMVSANLYAQSPGLPMRPSRNQAFLGAGPKDAGTRDRLQAQFWRCYLAKNWNSAALLARRLEDLSAASREANALSRVLIGEASRLVGRKNLAAANLLLAKAASLKTREPRFLDTVAALRLAQGKPKEAIESLMSAIASEPSNGVLRRRLGLISEGVGQFGNAVAALTEALALIDKQGSSKDLLRQYTLDWARVAAETGDHGAARQRVQSELGVPDRPASTAFPPGALDLTPFYNKALAENWPEGISQSNFAGLAPLGLKVLGGVSFDVRGAIGLNGGKFQEPAFTGDRWPEAVRNIPLGRKSPKLHFVHSTRWGNGALGTPVFRCELHYTNGDTRNLEIKLGENVRDWQSGRDGEPGLEVVWEGLSNGWQIRLFKTTWTNPLPDLDIHHIDLVSAMNEPVPFVVAITVE